VVPRLPEFSGFLFLLNDFQIRGVQLELRINAHKHIGEHQLKAFWVRQQPTS
jgi:hypothetical protein